MGSRKNERLKHKDHAQDGGTLIAIRDQYPAILPWSLSFGWQPSSRSYGHLARYAQRPDCCWTSMFERDLFGKPVSAFPQIVLLHMIVFRKSKVRLCGKSCENARQKRA
jgi:hypothetical protein